MEELWIPRPFVADEINCARLSDLLVELYPQLPRQSAAELMARQASLRSTGRPFQRLICGPPDEIWAMVTWRTPPWMAKNDMLLFAVCVAKAHQGQGHGPRLLAEVVAAAQACGATELGAQAFDTDPGTLRWLQRYGLAVAQTNQWSALSLKGPLPAPVVTTHQRVLGSGIELLDGDALAMRFPEDWETRWYQIEAAIERDVPSPILRDEITLEAWRRRCAGSEVQPRGFHFALEGSRVVGMTGVSLYPGEPPTAGVRLTGTLPSHRRRGLATALKVASCNALRQRGVERIITQNERDNPMLRLNMTLGFRAAFKDLKYSGSVVDVAVRLGVG